MGEQPLYHVNVELLNEDGAVLDCYTRRIGLRRCIWIAMPDEWAESFSVCRNGKPFFAKGGN